MKKYQSKYSPGKEVTELQYIIEIVCERNAAQTGRTLPLYFWRVSPWDVFYKSQLRKCNSLLKKYSSAAILKSLRDPRAKKVYSLFAPWLEKIIAEYHKKLSVEVKESIEPTIGGDKFTRPKKKNIIDKLNEL